MEPQIRFKIDRQVSFANGMMFGNTGPYERLVGRVEFAVHPTDPTLSHIVDLELAPLNKEGLVEFSGDLDILKPVDMSRGNRRLLYEVNNRGNHGVLRTFNEATASADPLLPEHAGNGYLMEKGYVVVWSGWQGDILPGGGALVAELPEALENGKRLRGVVRQELMVDRGGVFSMPVSGAANFRSYAAIDPSAATLTVREHEQEPRQPVPQDRWEFARAEVDPSLGDPKVSPSNTDIYIHDGFKPGWIYELIFETEGSRVMGLGLAGIRDLVAFLRYELQDSDGNRNPLGGAIDKAYAFGASLSARALREFIYEGFNEAKGRKVFDVIYPQFSGGGRVFLNQRFAQIGRFPRQHEEHQYPSERYPFAYGSTPDSFSDRIDSVLKRPESDPLVIHTHTATEYWQRHASVGQLDLRSGTDLEPPETVRMYFLSSMPHMTAAAAPGQLAVNTLSPSPFQRAMLELMDRWATDGVAPPESRLPTRAEGTLVPPAQALECFPKVPGVRLPAEPSRLFIYDYGPDFDHGIVTTHPPQATDHEYQVYVPVVDADGLDRGGLRSPDIEVPLGTYTGWSVRKPGFAEGDLLGLNGSFIPFARTRVEREAHGDPRLSIEERYQSHEKYIDAVTAAAERLVTDRLLLSEDAERYIAAAREKNPLDPSVPLGPLLRE